MNKDFDPLEAELQSLRPLKLSPPAQQRIANEINAALPAPAASPRHFARWTVSIAVLVAACLLIAFVLRPTTTFEQPDGPVAPEQASLTSAFDDTLPSVWTYRRALERSSLAAEELLDKHAALAPNSQSPSTPVFVRSPSAPILHGEL
jgi:hypothetical protein